MYRRLFYLDCTLCRPGDKGNENKRLKDKKMKCLVDVL